MARTRYAAIGTGQRCIGMFLKPLVMDFHTRAEIVGLCDINPVRMQCALEDMREVRPDMEVPLYTDAAKMLAETKPDVVLVATRDDLHAPFAVQALEAGCDVITEKPMTTHEDLCRDMLEAEKRTGKTITVTFNMRYGLGLSKMKELLMENHIGRIASVDFNYYLDTIHGADYYRRWHSIQEQSGGLLIHKSTHHFDVLNWLIEKDPVQIFAYGTRNRYGAEHAPKGHGKNCRSCDITADCPFYPDWAKVEHYDSTVQSAGAKKNKIERMYFDAEKEDGYLRDRCVFDKEINIPDTMNLAVQFTDNVQMSYSLNSYMAYEGYRLAINGTEGRIEMESFHRAPWQAGPASIRITKTGYEESRVVTIAHAGVNKKLQGGHGGADWQIREDLFGNPRPDPLRRKASSRAGAMSMLIGAAANKSMKTNQPVNVADLVPLDLINHRDKGYKK